MSLPPMRGAAQAGSVLGPGTSIDSAVCVFDGNDGNRVRAVPVKVSAEGEVTGISRLNVPIGWKDLIISSDATRNGASAPTFAAWNGNLFRQRFDNGQVNEVHFAWHMNHDYCLGTAVHMHVHWSPSTTNTGVCRWGFEWSYARGYSLDVFSAPTTTYADQAGSGTLLKHQIAETEAITIPNLETDGIIVCRAFRDGVADAFTGNAFAHTFDLHYQATHVATADRNRELGWQPA